MSYRVYGLLLDSEESLPELTAMAVASDGREADVRFRRSAGPASLPEHAGWFMHWRLPSGRPWLSAARHADGFVLRFHDLADFALDEKGGEIRCAPSVLPHAPETVRHLLIDHVLPLVLNLRGVEALHASAVLTGAGAILFTGPSGAGKSTLAAELARAGDVVLADDCVGVREKGGRFEVVPAYPGLRLGRDALGRLDHGRDHGPVAGYTDKRRFVSGPSGGVFHRAHPLRAVCVLEGGGADEIRAGALPPGRAVMELVARAFRLEVDDRRMLERQLDFFARMAGAVPVRRLAAPRCLDRLPELRGAVLNVV